MNEYQESIEGPEITDEAIEDFIEHGAEDLPKFHPLLQVWRKVLEPAITEQHTPVTPMYANRICSSYREINFADMNAFKDSYFAKVLALLDILDFEIASDEDCFRPTSPEEDVEQNGSHYKNLLLLWQQALVAWELDWDCTDADAAIELAAISEVHKMFFSENGLVNHLDSIGFQFDESDQLQLREALEEMKGGVRE